MYISILDYLLEIKKKFYIIIIFMTLFVGLSFSFQIYKQSVFELNIRANLIKLNTIKLKGNILSTELHEAIVWIGSEAAKKYKEKDDKNLPLNCVREIDLLVCFIKNNYDGNLDEVKMLMFESINSGFDEYKNYYLDIMDRLIIMNQELHEYVVKAEDTTIDSKATYKVRLENVKFMKNIFINALEDSRIELSDIETEKYQSRISYFFVILSSIICSLLVIFLQMRTEK
jgi:hypothetical protein